MARHWTNSSSTWKRICSSSGVSVTTDDLSHIGVGALAESESSDGGMVNWSIIISFFSDKEKEEENSHKYNKQKKKSVVQ